MIFFISIVIVWFNSVYYSRWILPSSRNKKKSQPHPYGVRMGMNQNDEFKMCVWERYGSGGIKWTHNRDIVDYDDGLVGVMWHSTASLIFVGFCLLFLVFFFSEKDTLQMRNGDVLSNMYIDHTIWPSFCIMRICWCVQRPMTWRNDKKIETTHVMTKWKDSLYCSVRARKKGIVKTWIMKRGRETATDWMSEWSVGPPNSLAWKEWKQKWNNH